MKKLLSLVTLCMVCFLSACSMFSTLDTDGKVTITHDYIEMQTVDYSHTNIGSLQTIVVKVTFENTKNKEMDFKVENAQRVNSKDKNDTSLATATPSTIIVGNKLNANQKVTYTFLLTCIDEDNNVSDQELQFDMNGKTITVKLKNKA